MQGGPDPDDRGLLLESSVHRPFEYRVAWSRPSLEAKRIQDFFDKAISADQRTDS